jgi:hypothetical protein
VVVDCKVVWGYEDVWVECLATQPNRLHLWGADASRRNGFGPSSTQAVPDVHEHIERNNLGGVRDCEVGPEEEWMQRGVGAYWVWLTASYDMLH